MTFSANPSKGEKMTGSSGNHIDAVRAGADAPNETHTGEVSGFTAQRIREAVTEGDGFWRTCSGCHESEEGQDVGAYPFSAVFNCKLGGGCGDCGGLGAIWDTTDYEAMGRAISERCDPPPPPWPSGPDNGKREGWNAYFAGREREKSPFPLGRADLHRKYREGWDAARSNGTPPSQSEPQASAATARLDEPIPSTGATSEGGEL